jgi:hypothetical protein
MEVSLKIKELAWLYRPNMQMLLKYTYYNGLYKLEVFKKASPEEGILWRMLGLH